MAKDGIIVNSLEDVLHNSMMPYAEYVILDRALPRVEDGLKPVQRRILYTMYNELGLTPDKPFVKSARIVGDCLGKFHPHGDRSVYDAMVRMAQPFNTRNLLVDGHGNFGSIDGDPAAAMRYTEAKLQPLSMMLLKDLDKDTVSFSLNYDDKILEPDMLPGRYPNLLVNGATGIAVGLATNIPPHNLAEVIDGVAAYIDNPNIKLKDLMKFIPGPDFPTGGYCTGGEELIKAYETGRGKVTMRAKVKIEQGDNDKKSIVITEIPYQVNKTTLLNKISDLREAKKEELAAIQDIADESDRINGIRAVIKLKKDADENAILDLLYKHTDLESTFGINMVAIAGGKPCQMGILEIIAYYADFQRQVILRRTNFELDKAKKRCHILEGLAIAGRNIDEVIKIIKNAENTAEAKAGLKKRFTLSDEQAQAILDLRLYRINKLEVYNLEKELTFLKTEIQRLKELAGSKKLQMDAVKRELLEIKREFKDERRTVIVGALESIKVESCDDAPPAENCVLTFTAEGFIKRISQRSFSAGVRAGGNKLSEIFKVTAQAVSNETAYAFTNLGNCYKFDISALSDSKFKDKGIPFSKVAPALNGEYPVAFYSIGEKLPEGSLLFYTKQGMIKKTDWSEYGLLKTSFQAAKLKDGDEIIKIEQDLPDTTVMFVTKKGMCLNALKEDIPLQGRISGGVGGIVLNDGDEVIYTGQIEGEGEMIIITSAPTFKRVICSQIDPMQRRRKGIKISELAADDSVVYADYVTEPYDVMIEQSSGEVSILNSEEISIEKRTSKGKTLKNLKIKDIKNCFRR